MPRSLAASLSQRIRKSEFHWNPQTNRIREVKACRHHAKNGVALPIEGDGFIDDRRIGSEAALPKAVTQNHNSRSAGLVFICGEDSALRRGNAERSKHIGCDFAARNAQWLTGTGQVVVDGPIEANVIKRGLMRLPIDKIWIGNWAARPIAARLAQLH